MLKNLIKSGFGDEKDFNCAEKILHGANHIYDLRLDSKALKLSTGFGEGMGIQSVCGALTAGIMVLSCKCMENPDYENSKIKEINQRFFNEFIKEMNSIQCEYLRKSCEENGTSCSDIVIKVAGILDELVAE